MIKNNKMSRSKGYAASKLNEVNEWVAARGTWTSGGCWRQLRRVTSIWRLQACWGMALLCSCSQRNQIREIRMSDDRQMQSEVKQTRGADCGAGRCPPAAIAQLLHNLRASKS